MEKGIEDAHNEKANLAGGNAFTGNQTIDGNRISVDKGWKTVTLLRTNWIPGNAGTSFDASHNYVVADADFVVGDVVDFEVGYGGFFNDIPIAENAGVYNTTISGVNGNIYFMTQSLPDADLRVKYKINK
jgi:hypothetical protein